MKCPVCKSENTKIALKGVQDFTVTNEKFDIAHCNVCTHRFTVDIPSEDEIGKYYKSDAYISHSNTQKGLVNRIYHAVRRFSLARKRALILRLSGKEYGNLLDIGCGIGSFLNTMKQANWQVTGLEPDEDARKQAENIYDITPQPSEQLFTLTHHKFDVVTMWHVLEHVHRLHEYVAQIKKLLSTEGILIVAVPNYTSWDASYYKEFWAGYDVPRHLHHFSPEAMQTLMQQHGFQVMMHKSMHFDPFYVSLLSESYIHKKQRLFAGFIQGFRSFWHSFNNDKACSSIIYIMKPIHKNTPY